VPRWLTTFGSIVMPEPTTLFATMIFARFA
jgi:hypothetical protein